ncbi:MAG TPA: O-antigen ligase family protein, partial [Salinimicrobium sp.]|nr:O-antigen ligase family protein [Salinimicrobium sp.]
LWLERPYFGIILSLGTFICLKNAEKFKKNDYYLLALLFIGFSIYISARLSILINCLLIFIYLLKSYRIQRNTKIWTGFGFVLLIAIALGLSDNLMSRMKITNDLDKTTHLIKAYEPRFVIWPCAMEIVENDLNLLMGLSGFNEYDEKLTSCYAETIEKPDKREYYLERKFNTHNQFLDILLIGGILPLLVLILSFFHVWFSKQYSLELKIVFLMFFLFFLVENALHRQLGCYLFGIFVALYSKKNE